MNKKLVYIGNNLNTKNPTTMKLLSRLLKEAGYEVIAYSDSENKLLRLMAMCAGVIKHRNANYLIIDTYSTLNFYYALLTSQIARLVHVPYIPILHGGELPKRLSKSKFLSNLIFKNSKVNIAPSNYLVEKFQEYGFKTQFIPNAIDLKQYTFQPKKTIAPTLLWVRAFDKIYNPMMALKVLVALRKTYSNARLCMIGPDKDGSLEHAKIAAKRYGIQDVVEFTGFLDKKSWVEKSNAFSIFINTTNIDNTPVSVLEALALGLPVVSTNVGGIPFLINNGINGILVENNDEQAMANAIIKLIENPIETHQMANNARSLVEGFDVARVKQQWRKLLEG
jgi:glycosyltransferase involved in cell wall biosynthesis